MAPLFHQVVQFPLVDVDAARHRAETRTCPARARWAGLGRRLRRLRGGRRGGPDQLAGLLAHAPTSPGDRHAADPDHSGGHDFAPAWVRGWPSRWPVRGCVRPPDGQQATPRPRHRGAAPARPAPAASGAGRTRWPGPAGGAGRTTACPATVPTAAPVAPRAALHRRPRPRPGCRARGPAGPGAPPPRGRGRSPGRRSRWPRRDVCRGWSRSSGSR